MKSIRYIPYFIIVLSLSCLYSCSAEGKYVTPFSAEYYNCGQGIEAVVEKHLSPGGKTEREIEYRFDSTGKLLFERIFSDNIQDTVIYGYNGLKLERIEQAGKNYRLNYNNSGELSGIVCSQKNKEGVWVPEYERTFVYFDDGKLLRDNIDYSGKDNESTTYVYYANGRIKSSVRRNSQETVEVICDSVSGRVAEERYYTRNPSKLSRTYSYSYTVDSSGYWTVAVIKDARGRVSGKIVREFPVFDSLIPVPGKGFSADIKPVKPVRSVADYVGSVELRWEAVNTGNNAPSKVLFLIVMGLTLLLSCGYMIWMHSKHALFSNFSGIITNDYGIKRMWMFNKEPYIKVVACIGLVFAAFLSAIAVLLAIGGVTYGLLWLLKIILLVIIWVGSVALVLGILAVLFAKSSGGCLPIIIGGIIVGFEEQIKSFGERCVEWGFGFMQELNIFNWGIGLITEFWDVILAVFFIPIVVFAVIAIFIIVSVYLLMGIEIAIMKLYSIRRPCPSCGSTRTPEYWVDEHHRHPIPLHPGMYGVFRQFNPSTGKMIPTMLLNGKGRLFRKCRNCGILIRPGARKTVGTEKHIGIVGHRSSGKSYLLYSALDELHKYFGDRFSQVDADYDTNIESNVMRINKGRSIQTDVKDAYRAVQVMIDRKMNPVPYHLFFYDVAGEKFNQASRASKTAMEFYRNVQTVIFVIDPAMIDDSFCNVSDRMKKWSAEHYSPEKFSIEGILSTLKTILEGVGRKTKDIDCVFICTKRDTGYFEACNPLLPTKIVLSSDYIEKFMRNELGLGNLINSANGSFRNVSYAATSTTGTYKKQLTEVFLKILNRMNVS